jgi:DNA-binding CsgD family transcriptional regulator
VIGRAVTCPVFVGRRAELDALDEARRELRKSHGSFVLVGGEAGIGKSRLVAEFVRRSGDIRSRNLAAAECIARAQVPFGPVRALLTALVPKIPRDELTIGMRGALAQLVPEAIPDGAFDGSSELAKPDLFAALVAFLKLVAAKRLTVLTIEDLHWSDPSTLEFLAFLAPRIASSRLLVVATYRSDEVEARAELFETVSRLVREANVYHLRLGPFGPEELRELIDATLDASGQLTDVVKRDVERRSEGNPFFAEELLKNALAWRDERALPLSIRASIVERLSLLSNDDRALLALAAALGYRFDPKVLALVGGCEIDAVLPTLRRARDLNVLAENEGDRARYRFRHALTRQTIYEGMLGFDARRLHERILSTLERLGDEDDHLEELAYHAAEARVAAKALAYNERAGERALAVRALAEATTFFEAALAFAVGEEDRARILERIGSAFQQQGQLRRGVDAFERAFEIRRRRGEFDAAAGLFTSIVGDRSNLGDGDTVHAAERFVDEYGARLSREPRDRLLALSGRLASAWYDFDATRRLLAQTSPPAELAPAARQNYYIARLNEHAAAGDARAWSAVADELFAFVSELTPYLATIALFAIGQTGTYISENERVERAFQRADAILADGDFGGIAAFGAAAKAAYLVLRGKLGAARTLTDLALSRPEVFVAQVIAARFGPYLALALGDERLAERTLQDDVVRDAREGSVIGESPLVLAARARWLSARGRAAEARADVRLALSGAHPTLPQMGLVAVEAAEILDLAELARLATSIDEWRTAPDRGRQAAAALVRAIVAGRRGERDEATVRGAEAAALYREIGWPLYEARALESAGRTEEAADLYLRCGAVADVARFADPRSVPARPEASNLSVLSAREREVAMLVTDGLTNTAIGARLSLAEKTIEKYLSAIFVKLGVRSRAQIAAVVAREPQPGAESART